MKAVILDAATLGADINLSPIQSLVSELRLHDTTSVQQLTAHLADAQLVITNKVTLNRTAMLGRAAIFILATGTNNIDHQAAKALGVPVYNVANYGADYVAQHTWMLMLALAGQLGQYRKQVASGAWQASPYFCLNNFTTTQLAGKHLVLQGGGDIGGRVAAIAHAFGMKVSYAARPGDQNDTRPSLMQLLPSADVVSFHCPLTPSTQHLLNADTLALIKPSCLVINCARGGVIDEQACLEVLRRGGLGGLACDVLPTEPPVKGHPLLAALSEPINLIVTPHNAWISPEARQKIVQITAANIQHFMKL